MSRRGRTVLSGLAVVVLFLLPLLPEILGTRRLIFRDAQITHWPWRRLAVESLRLGEVPFVNESASGGQPFLANPNAALLYPTLLLEMALPSASAFNLHYLLHVLWAFFGARALACRLGLSKGPAFFAGVCFAFSGMMLSYGSAFLNSSAAAAWLPWCAAAGLDLARARGFGRTARAAAAVAVAFGLQLLAGEPALSLLTFLFVAVWTTAETLAVRSERRSRVRNLLAGASAGGLTALLLAAPMLLPLYAVFPLTYRGQHAYSQRAFEASSFSAWRLVEWLFPRFGGDPGALGAGAHWQYALHQEEIIYIWTVTFGVIPLLLVLLAALRPEFWKGRSLGLAAGALLSLLFAVGSPLPLTRLLFSIEELRRLRYPIKFYLLTTLCVALLAGLAAEGWKERRPGRRERIAAAAVITLYAIAFLAAVPGGLLDLWVGPLLQGLALPGAALLPPIRQVFRTDALLGALSVAVAGLILFFRGTRKAYLLGIASLVAAFSWGLPLFVSADQKALTRPPALLPALSGPGRLYVSPRLPEFNMLASGSAHPQLPPRVARLARVQIEELIPATGAPFGIRYAFDSDPDGFYGYYNRLAGEAVSRSTPAERIRLLETYGVRWLLTEEGETYPPARPVTGLAVAGRRLTLHELAEPREELRWAGREHRRASLDGALDLLRSDRFRPATDIVLPGRADHDAQSDAGRARMWIELLRPDRAAARVEAARAGHLLFSRTWFPAWEAKLDGRDVPVLVGNARDLAVRVPPGSHSVEFRYDRRPFEWECSCRPPVFWRSARRRSLGSRDAEISEAARHARSPAG